MKKNIFYAQSGGVTPVINATAAGLIDAYNSNKNLFGKLYIEWHCWCIKRRID